MRDVIADLLTQYLIELIRHYHYTSYNDYVSKLRYEIGSSLHDEMFCRLIFAL